MALVLGLIGCATGAAPGGATTDTQATDGPTSGDQGTGDDASADDQDSNDLTDLEKQAVVAASNAPGALAQGIDVTEDSTGDLGGDDGDAAQIIPEDITFGTCPEVSKTGSLSGIVTASVTDALEGEGAVTLAVDFGEEPCTALVVEEESGEDFTLTCSGNASGTFSLTDQNIALEFNGISCNDQALDGTADLTYNLLTSGVELQGAWDLTWYPGDEAIGTEGEGIGSYQAELSGCCDVITIDEFIGNVTNDGYEWTSSMEDILISVEKYYSLIPYGGSITVDGPDIREITITFNENSPTTGEVTISIENGRAFTVTLYELEQWAEMIVSA